MYGLEDYKRGIEMSWLVANTAKEGTHLELPNLVVSYISVITTDKGTYS